MKRIRIRRLGSRTIHETLDAISAPRDPRRDPEPGDVLRLKRGTITVLRWPGERGDVWKTAIRWRDNTTNLPFTSVSISYWRRLVKDATVVRGGE